MRKFYRPIPPVELKDDLRPGDKFDAPRHGGRRHAGIDIYNDECTTVKASLSGKVLRASWHDTYGNIVIIGHTPEIDEDQKTGLRCYVYTVYAHLHCTGSYTPGKTVQQGDNIGSIGNTGNAKGMKPHVHFETIRARIKLAWQSSGNTGIKARDHRVDPLDFLTGFTLPKECFETSTSKASSGCDRFQRGRFSA